MVMQAWAVEARKDWEASYGGTVSDMSIVLALEPLVAAYGWDRIRPCWIAYLHHVEEHQADPRSFAKMVPNIVPETPQAPRQMRITEAELQDIEHPEAAVPEKHNMLLGFPCAYVEPNLREIRLVAEIRRMRRLIVSVWQSPSKLSGVGLADLSVENAAIRSEENPHE